MATESKQITDALAEWGKWFPTVAALIQERDAELELRAAELATAKNNAASWFTEQERFRAAMEAALIERDKARADVAALDAQVKAQAATVAELSAKLAAYPDHPEVKAARVKQLESLAAATNAELAKLRPAT